MKKLLLLSAAGAFLASGCASPSRVNEHWSLDSISYRAARVFAWHEPDKEPSFWAYQRDYNWAPIGYTLERHFLNYNRENPFQNQ